MREAGAQALSFTPIKRQADPATPAPSTSRSSATTSTKGGRQTQPNSSGLKVGCQDDLPAVNEMKSSSRTEARRRPANVKTI